MSPHLKVVAIVTLVVLAFVLTNLTGERNDPNR
jgi:hypothetical protein